MKKKIKFQKPLNWKTAASLSFLAGSVFISYGGDDKIYAIKVEEKEFNRITANLKKKKIAFKIEG